MNINKIFTIKSETMKKKRFYEKKGYLILNVVAITVVIVSGALNSFGIMSKITATIIDGSILLVLAPLVVSMLWRMFKDKKLQAQNEEVIHAPLLLRGDILDRQVGKQIPRNQNEDDWAYVKRIFPIICETNPTGAVSILLGKSITELDETNKWLAGTFLSSKKKKYDIEKFLKGFGNSDPAYN